MVYVHLMRIHAFGDLEVLVVELPNGSLNGGKECNCITKE